MTVDLNLVIALFTVLIANAGIHAGVFVRVGRLNYLLEHLEGRVVKLEKEDEVS